MGLAMRRRKLAERIVGIGRRAASLEKALKAGAVDCITTDLQAGARHADLTVLATPVESFGGIAAGLAQCMKKGAVLTEVGSTKESVIDAVGKALKERSDIAFIPTHPMAGSEKRGPENALPYLFEGSVCIFTPPDDAPREAVQRLQELWEALGAAVCFMSPQQHDRLVARISHVPHLAAAALINSIEAEEGRFSGKGLVDATRIASGEPQMWAGICRSNSRMVIDAIDSYIGALSAARNLIASQDFTGLESWLAEAGKKRANILKRKAEGE